MKLLLLLPIFLLSACASTKHSQFAISENTIKVIKNFEGFSSKPYYCAGRVKTLGYGSTGKYIANRSRISVQEADKLLRQELNDCRKLVLASVTVKINNTQLESLVSFTMNCGPGALNALINGANRLNSGNYKSIENILPYYRRAGGKIRLGLQRRRAWELALWKGQPFMPNS